MSLRKRPTGSDASRWGVLPLYGGASVYAQGGLTQPAGAPTLWLSGAAVENSFNFLGIFKKNY